MRFTKVLLAAAAVSMTASPVLAAAANPAAKLSVAPSSARVGAKSGKSELLGGGVFVAIIAVVAVIVGVIIVANTDDKPDSP